jgi:hypothetical protein
MEWRGKNIEIEERERRIKEGVKVKIKGKRKLHCSLQKAGKFLR